MTNEKIKEIAKQREQEEIGDFFIGCTMVNPLPNGKTSSLICIDCSWLTPHGEKPILARNELDLVEGGLNGEPSVNIQIDDIVFTKWCDMVDEDGDVHHCKIESFLNLSDDIFSPVENADSADWVIYVEV